MSIPELRCKIPKLAVQNSDFQGAGFRDSRCKIPESTALTYLKRLLAKKQARTELRYRHYEMKSHPSDLFSTAEMKEWNLRPVLGWCPKADDSFADRLQFQG